MMPPTPHLVMTTELHEKLKQSGLLGWQWNPAWVASKMSRKEVREHVPPFDVTEFVIPRTACPKRVWFDPLD
jgi:hypothetical protein